MKYNKVTCQEDDANTHVGGRRKKLRFHVTLKRMHISPSYFRYGRGRVAHVTSR